MSLLLKSIANKNTTILGSVMAVLVYWQSIGTKLPVTHQEWFAFLVASAIAGLAVLAKDGSTGSSPGDV